MLDKRNWPGCRDPSEMINLWRKKLLEGTIRIYGDPAIFNTDKGIQFNSERFRYEHNGKIECTGSGVAR